MSSEIEPDSPAWWKRQVVYIMDEMFHALRQSITANTEEDRLSWMKRADYLQGKGQQCILKAFQTSTSLYNDNIPLQKEEKKQ